MKITFKIDAPANYADAEKEQFITLLEKQGQVSHPTMEKINLCYRICLLYFDELPIGIGALKQVYNSPFDHSGLPELKEYFKYELGYLFIDNVDNKYRRLGLGKMISRLLLSESEDENIFATTDLSESSPMKYILNSLGFEQQGKPYLGRNTQKLIGLFLKSKKNKE